MSTIPADENPATQLMDAGEGAGPSNAPRPIATGGFQLLLLTWHEILEVPSDFSHCAGVRSMPAGNGFAPGNGQDHWDGEDE